MTQVIKSMSDLKKHMNVVCNKAVENACNRLLGTLQELIDTEFYDVFEPDYYKRTYQFWRSATTKMLTENCGQVFMDKDIMNYNSFWTAEKQLYHANIGSHGGWITDESKDHKFWEAFIAYCDQNAIKILKEELRKCGITIK